MSGNVSRFLVIRFAVLAQKFTLCIFENNNTVFFIIFSFKIHDK